MDSFFLINISQIANYLKVADTFVLLKLQELEGLNFLCIYNAGIKDGYMVEMFEQNIITFIENMEKKRKYFDRGLKLTTSLNPKIQHTSFRKATYKLMDFVNRNMKNSEKIPMVTYACCNYIMKAFNIKRNSFIFKKPTLNYVYECINDKDFEPKKLSMLIASLCEARQKQKKKMW